MSPYENDGIRDKALSSARRYLYRGLMRILAIDTALSAVSACVLDASALEVVASETVPMERGHAEALPLVIGSVIAKVDGGFASISRLAVTVGPGSFTGVRIGLAAAQGIALARKVEVVGVSTLAALAAPHLIKLSQGVVVATIDARNGQVYVAAFGLGGRMLLSPRRLGARDAFRAIGASPVLLVGSGAAAMAQEARSTGDAVRVVDPSPTPDIVFVARLGLIADPQSAPALPMYLKPPDAQPSRRAAPGSKKDAQSPHLNHVAD